LDQAALRSASAKLLLSQSKKGIFGRLFLINIYQNLFKFYQIANVSEHPADFLG
jgi:hypothetical protein